MPVVFCVSLISRRTIWHFVCSDVYIVCLNLCWQSKEMKDLIRLPSMIITNGGITNLCWQSKEMKDLIRLPSMIITNGGTICSIYPIMAELWFYVITTCLFMPYKPNWSTWRWPLFIFKVITDIQILNFVLNDFLNTTNKYKNSITMNIMQISVVSQYVELRGYHGD